MNRYEGLWEYVIIFEHVKDVMQPEHGNRKMLENDLLTALKNEGVRNLLHS